MLLSSAIVKRKVDKYTLELHSRNRNIILHFVALVVWHVHKDANLCGVPEVLKDV